MKIIVSSTPLKENQFNYSEIERKNRKLMDIAFVFQNKWLFGLERMEPLDLEVSVNFYYDQDGLIKWTFVNQDSIPPEVKEQIREFMHEKL